MIATHRFVIIILLVLITINLKCISLELHKLICDGLGVIHYLHVVQGTLSGHKPQLRYNIILCRYPYTGAYKSLSSLIC